MSIKTKRGRQWMYLIAAHLFVASLAVTYSCGTYDTTGHGPYVLSLPTAAGLYQDTKRVEFFLDEEVENGTMTGWIRASGCQVWVDLCDGGYCETVFTDFVGDWEEMFEVTSDQSVVFGNYLDKFEMCYKGGEMWQEPMSCQNWSCADSVGDITILFQSECPATLQTEMEIKYFDERTPYKGPLYACASL